MPRIDLHGQRTGQSQGPEPPEPSSGQGPQARGSRAQSDFDRAQRERLRSEKEQARIDAQADRAWRRHEQAQAKFEREREQAFKRNEQAERRRQAELNRSTREEVRARETARRAFDLRSGMSDRLRMIASLGRRGMGAAASGRNRDLHAIERTLRNIARATEGQLKFSRSPSERANVARVEDHILSAGRRIALGRQFGRAAGLRPGRLGAAGRALASGRGLGSALGELMEGSALAEAATGIGLPLAAATLLGGEAIKTAITIPGKAARLYASLAAGAAPYTSLRVGTARLGRAGSFNSLALQKSLYNDSRLPTWMSDLGLTPQSVVGLLSNGPAPTSRGEALGLVQDIGRAALMPGMPGQEALNSYRQVLQNLGITRPGSARAIPGTGGSGFTTSLSGQYDKLQKLMTQSVALGVDSSTVLRSTMSFMQSQAAAGAISASAPNELFSRMLASGLPAARTGALEATATAGFNAAMRGAGLGGNVTSTLMLMSGSGLPSTAEGLRKKLGLTSAQWQSFIGTPGGQRMLKDYLAAPSPAFRAYILGQMVQGHPEFAPRLFGQSFYSPAYRNPALRDIIMGSVTGLGYEGAVALNSKGASHGAYLAANVDLNPLNLTYAGQEGAIGVDYRAGHRFAKFRTLEQGFAADYRQLLRYESRGFTTTRQLIRQWAGPNAPASYVRDVVAALGVSPDTPINLRDKATAEKFMRAMLPHESGAIGAGTSSSIAGGIALAMGQPMPQTGNVPTQVFAMNANAAGLNLNTARQNFEAARIASNTGAVYAAQQASDFVVKGFTDVGNASVGTAAALERLKATIESILPHVSHRTPIPFSVAPGAGSMPLPGPSRP